MKNIALFLTSLFLFACNTAPVIVPDTTKDNVVMKKLNWEIENNNHITSNWGWILWYLPIVFLVVVWAYNQYLKAKCKEEETTKSPTDQAGK
jgi:nucleoside recognition membrane protein YjiH